MLKALIPTNAFFEIGIKEIKISTIAVVEVITVFDNFWALLFDIKKEGLQLYVRPTCSIENK